MAVLEAARPGLRDGASTVLEDEMPLVEICGLEHHLTPVDVEGIDAKEMTSRDFNGEKGRIVGRTDGKLIVHTLGNSCVIVPEEKVRPWTPLPAEEGGFDLLWPSRQEAFGAFAGKVGELLADRGWCLVQMPMGESRAQATVRQAESMAFTVPKEELALDLLGRDGSGKLAHFSPDDRGRDCLSQCSLEQDRLLAHLREMSLDLMGFNCYSRTKMHLWMPFAEDEECRSETLSDEDVAGGVIRDHLMFIQRRKICMMYLVEEGSSGELELYQPDSPERPFVRIQVSGWKLLLFRHDQLGFAKRPSGGRFLTLQTWVLDDPLQVEIDAIHGDVRQKSALRGLEKGVNTPAGERTHIMSFMCRLPGNASNPQKYINSLAAGIDAPRRIPVSRFDATEYCDAEGRYDIPGRSNACHGGFCSDADVFSFDNVIFGITTPESARMAPNQRVILEVGYQTFQLSGHSKASLRNHNCGVFVGDCGTDVWPGWNVSQLDLTAPHAMPGIFNFVTVNRLSHTLGLRGPICTVDTACSSSLVCATLAQNALRQQGSDQEDPVARCSALREALSVGVTFIVSAYFYIILSPAHLFSSGGRCFTFDASGDGYGRGEGCAAVHLKRSEDDFDIERRMGALIGATTNQDGKSATLTAPNGPSQQDCIRKSLAEAGIDTSEVMLAECHGTGTALGDPIEVGAIRRVVELELQGPLILTSAKTHIGHLEASAGAAGLQKCLVMLMMSTASPSQHLVDLNSHLDVKGFPAVFETEMTDLNMNSAVCGVSSFGYGGTNARGDVWAECQIGHNKTSDLDLDRADQIYVTCPITLEPIDWLSGEPLSSTRRARRYQADVLRDEFAPYDISAHAYKGGYRYRSQWLAIISEQEPPPDAGIYICGSWSGWEALEAMKVESSGWCTFPVVLGEGRYELFYLCVGQDRTRRVYPAAKNASARTWIRGPDDEGHGFNWRIDGRDAEVPAGTAYQVSFRWGRDLKALYWEQIPESELSVATPEQRAYYVAGSWTTWQGMQLEADGEQQGVYSTTVTVGPQGWEEFHFMRDNDPAQVIYPALPKGTDAVAVPVRGPDDLGAGKHWLVESHPGDMLRLELRIADAAVSVSASSAAFGAKIWKSRQGWARHDYFVTVSAGDKWQFVPMAMESETPGLFKAQTALPEVPNAAGEYATLFRVAVDRDMGCSYRPAAHCAFSGESMARGPDGKGQGECWLAISHDRPGAKFEVALNLLAEDRRRIVTWEFM